MTSTRCQGQSEACSRGEKPNVRTFNVVGSGAIAVGVGWGAVAVFVVVVCSVEEGLLNMLRRLRKPSIRVDIGPTGKVGAGGDAGAGWDTYLYWKEARLYPHDPRGSDPDQRREGREERPVSRFRLGPSSEKCNRSSRTRNQNRSSSPYP